MKKGLKIANRFMILCGLIIGAFLALLQFNGEPTQAAAGVNQYINFQGRLLNSQGATVPDGFYNIQFKIYQDGTGQAVGNPGGTLEWTESHLNDNSQGVKVVNGFFSVQLGSVTAFGSSVDWDQDTLWLSMNIGSTNASCTPFSNCSPDGEMIPMQRMTSAPYALNSGRLGGLTSSQFVQLGQGLQADASTATSIAINKTGAGDIIDLQSGGSVVFNLSNTGALTLQNSTDSTAAFQIQDQDSNALFVADTENMRIGIGTAAANVAGEALTVRTGDGYGFIHTNGTNSVGTYVDGDGGWFGTFNNTDLNFFQGNAGPALKIAGNGIAIFKNYSDQTNAFQVQDSDGNAVLAIDTVNNRVGIGTAEPTQAMEVNGGGSDVGAMVNSGATDKFAVFGTSRTGTFESLFGTAAANAQLNPSAVAGDTIVRAASAGKLLLGSQAANVVVRNNTASTNAFDVLNTSGTSVFSVDTSNNRVGIGGAPSQQLDVAGNAEISSLFIGDVGWSSFGFYGFAHSSRANTTDYALIQGANGGTIINSASGQSTLFRINNAEIANFSSTGLSVTVNGGKTTLRLSNTGTDTGLTIGGDTNLYRSAANILASDDEFRSFRTNTTDLGFSVQASSLGGFNTWRVTANGSLAWGSGAGSADTNLYRSAANTLKTDDNFHVQTGTNSTSAFLVQNASGASLFNINNNGTNVAVNGGAEAAFGSEWAAFGTSSVARTTTSGQFPSGTAAVSTTPTAANSGVKNNLGAALTANTTYLVSFTAKLASGSMTDLTVRYDRSSGTQDVVCSNYNSQSIDNTAWKKITCSFTTSSTAGDNTASINIYQAGSATRTIYIDNLNVAPQTTNGTLNVNQIGIGGANGQGLTLVTLDSSTGAPTTNDTINPALYGSMYYDTTSGRIHCYEADGWGPCGGSIPDSAITLAPEYPGAVLNGSGTGTMTADFCSNDTDLQVNTGVCASGTSRNYYKWTSPQASQQTYSIYATYKLPDTFTAFEATDTIKLTAMTDNTTNGAVDYQVFRKSGSAVASCGSQTSVTSASANTWHTVAFSGDETACGFAAGDTVLFKINVRANSNAVVYVENLEFTYLNE